MNKKHFLLLFTLICLGVGNAWGIDWVGEKTFTDSVTPSSSTVGQTSAHFLLYNAEAKLWLGHRIIDNTPYPYVYSDSTLADTFRIEIYHQSSSYYKYGLITTIGGTNYFLSNKDGTTELKSSKDDEKTEFNHWDAGNTSTYAGAYEIRTKWNDGGTGRGDKRYMCVATSGTRLLFKKTNECPSNYRSWQIIYIRQFRNHIAYNSFLNRKAEIDTDLTDYSACASYSAFTTAKAFSRTSTELVTENTSTINGAISTLNEKYVAVKEEYAENNKATYLATLSTKISEANSLVSSPMNKTILATLSSYISAANNITTSNSGSEIVEATDNLVSAIADANTSITIYSTFNSLVSTIAEQVATFDVAGRTAYNNSSAVLPYNNRTMTDGATEKANLYAALRLAAKAQTTSNADMTLAINNPSFELGDLTGWSDGEGMLHKVVSADDTSNGIGDVSSSGELDGDYVYACYNGSQANMYLSQTIDGLHPGEYELKLRLAGNTNSSNDYKLKISFGSSNKTISLSSTTSMQEETLSLTLNETSGVVVKVEYNTPNKTMSNPWFKVDNFTLKLVSSSVEVDAGAAGTASNWGWCDGVNHDDKHGDYWKDSEKKVVSYGETSMVQIYCDESNSFVGDIISYTKSGLTNGFYTANVGLNVHCANWGNKCPPAANTDQCVNVAVLKINNKHQFTTPLQINTAAVGECRTGEVSNIKVTDNTMTFTVSTLTAGANWITVSVNDLTYEGVDVFKLHVSAAGWASVCIPFDANIPLGVTAYYAKSINTTSIVLSPIEAQSIAAGEAIIVQADEGDYTFTAATHDLAEVSNYLHGTSEHTTFTSGEKYILSVDESNNPIFVPLIKDNATNSLFYDAAPTAYLPAYKAYVNASDIPDLSPSRLTLIVEDINTTTNVEANKASVPTQKVFRNGQILIIRGNETFDVIGRRIQ